MIIESLRARLIIVIGVLLLGLLIALPNMVNIPENWWIPHKKMTMGLDIQGGLHLVLGADIPAVLKESTIRLEHGLQEELKKTTEIEKIEIVDGITGEMHITAKSTADAEKISDFIGERYAGMLQVITRDNNIVVTRYYETYVNSYRKRVMDQAIETIRNRIDEFGVSEPSISSQGINRILVQLPGIKDAAKAKELINTTARLDFMLVHEGAENDPQKLQEIIDAAEKAGNYNLTTLRYSEYVSRLNEDIREKIPKNTYLYFEKSPNVDRLELGKIPYLLDTTQVVGGSDLEDAYVSYDEYGKPEVAFRFNAVGSKKFGDLTGTNIKKRLAVVLDKVVKSAPVIQSKITNSGRITLGSARDMQKQQSEAQTIAMALRAGALPASLEQLEERTVGPSLGADSITKGVHATAIGALAVFIFMILFYGYMGVIANVALIMNILYLISSLTSLGATLTLPGVAGIALTIGIAVDANIIINERIKEELRRGVSLKLALREGYERAFTAIFDSHVTTIATGIVLIYYGTGPVKGFGVSLVIGLVISLFTSVFVTHAIIEWLVTRFNFSRIRH